MAGDVLELTDAGFEQEVLNCDLPVVVDMWAPWCGPCRMVSPVIEELAAENSGKIKFCKMNVDENQQEAGKLGITSIPTVLFFKDGRERVDMRLIGVQPKIVYQKAIGALLGG
jgi:thioredoxin 1